MLSVHIRAIGKPSETWHKQALHMYAERLASLASFELRELNEGHEGSSKPDINKTLQNEGLALLKNIPTNNFVIALDEQGQEYSSSNLAEQLKTWSDNGQRPLFFLLGGSWGLHKEVKDRAQVVLSLSPMTMPHILARIVLLEQLYRCLMIQAGRTYHK